MRKTIDKVLCSIAVILAATFILLGEYDKASVCLGWAILLKLSLIDGK